MMVRRSILMIVPTAVLAAVLATPSVAQAATPGSSGTDLVNGQGTVAAPCLKKGAIPAGGPEVARTCGLWTVQLSVSGSRPVRMFQAAGDSGVTGDIEIISDPGGEPGGAIINPTCLMVRSTGGGLQAITGGRVVESFGGLAASFPAGSNLFLNTFQAGPDTSPSRNQVTHTSSCTFGPPPTLFPLDGTLVIQQLGVPTPPA
ncbi:MAG: hypothetical protein ACYDA2_03725 [Acidimicrobiales bacterium]